VRETPMRQRRYAQSGEGRAMQVREVLPICCVFVEPLDTDRKLSAVSPDMRNPPASIGNDYRLGGMCWRRQ
jgi:hypothetical protein